MKKIHEELRDVCYKLLIESLNDKECKSKKYNGVHIYYDYDTDTMVIEHIDTHVKMIVSDVQKELKLDVKGE